MADNAVFTLARVFIPGRDGLRLEIDDLSIGSGITAVLGRSGAGKTTLLDVLVGFQEVNREASISRPTDGDPLPLFWAPAQQGLWPHLDPRQHLQAVAAESADVDGWLARFDLLDLDGARPARLSHGQRARLLVARAVASGARTLVLDEPLVHVDPARAAGYWRVLVQHLRETGTNLVFATHDPAVVLAHADSVLCLDGGRPVYSGPIEDLYFRPDTPELAGFLGPANWLARDESDLWLGATSCDCLRPEQLAIARSDDGPLVVEASSFHGALTTSTLRHPEAGTRVFHHRSPSERLDAGSHVVLRLCLAILLSVCAFTQVACSRGEATELMRATRHRQLPALGKRLPAPRGLVATANGELWVLDNAGRVLTLAADGSTLRSFMMPAYEIGRPEGVCLLRDGRVAVADTHYSRVVFFDREGTVLSTMGRRGNGPTEFAYPIKIIQDDQGCLYVAEYGFHEGVVNDRVQKFTEKGKFLLSIGSHGEAPGQFQRPSGLVWDAGKLYVADAVNHRVQVFTDEGKFLRVLDEGQTSLDLKLPYDLAQGPSGDLYVCEYGGCRITRCTKDGRLVGRFGLPGRGKGQLKTPWGVTVAADGRVLVADTGNHRIVEWQR